MRKNLFHIIYLLLLFIILGEFSFAQSYNNEWIANNSLYGKTYYKFKILNNGLYRITGETLTAAGINAQGSQLQLWHNGQQVPIYTNNTGTLGNADYIEFWGQQNDGSTDAGLFQNPADQINKAKSFETDSSAYFLVINTNTANNINYTNNGAPTIPSGLSPEPYFFYTIQNNLGTSFNPGPAVSFGNADYVYLSDYQYKIFGTTITPSASASSTFSNLYPYTAQNINSTISVGIAGNSTVGTQRKVTVNLSSGGNVLTDIPLGAFQGTVLTANNFKVTGDVKATIKETNAPSASDRAIVSFAALTYPRTFNFGGQNSFAFNVKASTTQRLLQITNFNANSSTPILYDITHNQRYSAVVAGSTYQFLLPPGDSSNLVMVGQSSGSYALINNSQLIKHSFIDIRSSSNQGNFLIISHKTLINGSGGYVQQYQLYRNSSDGGNYTAKIYDIEDLEDQFAFGIRNHPLSIKNFLRYARANFSTKPAYVFLIGHGLSFNNTYGTNGSNPAYQAKALLPTFGFPASDILLASDNFSPIMAIPIGRLPASNPEDVAVYLAKVKAYDQAQNNSDHSVDNNLWKKNIVYASGGGNASEESLFGSYLNNYERIMNDTALGSVGYYFTNNSSSFNTTPNSALNTLFSTGLNLINYYGHGASTSIGYTQLGDPNNFDNAGKFPLIFASGCDLGNCFDYMQAQPIVERFLLTPDKGSVGYMAQTSLGVTNYLHAYNLVFYQNLASTSYGKAIAYSMIEGQRKMIASIRSSDSITYLSDAAQTIFLGDPSLALFHSDKPDFAVEAAHVIAPQSVSITQNKFTVKAYLYNIGKAVGDSVQMQIQRKLASGTTETLLSKFIPSVTAIDSVQVDVPIDPDKDAGNNDIIVTIDGNSHFDELSESNNTATKTVVVYTNGLNPVYPYNYSIIHDQTAHLIASTSDALAAQQNYVMELDTTNLFNSSFKKTVNVTSVGGAIDFDPHVSYSDSMVYYWRVSPAPTAQNNLYNWAYASFQYIGTPNTDDGFGQSHVHQHEASSMQRIFLDSASRQWYFDSIAYNFLISQLANVGSNNPPASAIGFKINGVGISSYYCTNIKNLLIFNVFTPDGMKPYFNSASAPSVKPDASAGVSAGVGKGYMGSTASCGTSKYNFDGSSPAGPNTGKYDFEFSYQTPDNRNAIAEFMNWIPDGSYVVARLLIVSPVASVPLVGAWQTDGTNSAYDAFKAQGLDLIDNFTEPNSAVFIYKKNDKSFVPVQQMTSNYNQSLQVIKDVYGKDTLGFVTSPKFGPAAKWKTLQWNGYTKDSVSTIDRATVTLIGYDANGNNATTLDTYTTSQQNQDVSSIDAAKYPYLQMQLRNADSLLYTPYQLRYWHLLYTPVPEGALAGNIKLNAPDTINAGQDYNFTIAFKNISNKPFTDSILAKVNLTTASNSAYTIQIPNLKKLQPGDTSTINITIPGDTSIYNQNVKNPLLKAVVPTTSLSGANTLSLSVNPDFAQPEQTLVNNQLFKQFFVKSSNANTNLDVTFDGVHILNNDIVAAKPDVIIHLVSNSKYILLTDTASAKISLKYPDGTIRNFSYNNDTLTFIPAKDSSNNEAMIDFKPYLTQDGTYELIVNGKSANGNTNIASGYSVSFQVFNKPMISDMFNYPNPFTSSTAFVFTITGSEVPQNIRIEILTITGKIVKEITKAELGNLHVGRNITDYKWDGTDMYGQKLANGVYLYRVITNENGKRLDKFNITDQNNNSVNTGKYFNKGYGKMYLMR